MKVSLASALDIEVAFSPVEKAAAHSLTVSAGQALGEGGCPRRLVPSLSIALSLSTGVTVPKWRAMGRGVKSKQETRPGNNPLVRLGNQTGMSLCHCTGHKLQPPVSRSGWL